MLCHNKLTKHHLLLSISWIRCVSLACKLSMADRQDIYVAFIRASSELLLAVTILWVNHGVLVIWLPLVLKGNECLRQL